MSEGFSRRYFFYGSLLAGAVPIGGFGIHPVVVETRLQVAQRETEPRRHRRGRAAGRRSAAGPCRTGKRRRHLRTSTGPRGHEWFERFPKATKYNDYRQMLDKSGKDIDAIVIGTADHMHATCALARMQPANTCMSRNR